MSFEDSRITLLRRAAILCALLVITIVSISAFIRLSGSGLGCSPWPQCYGQGVRDQQLGVTPATDKQADKAITTARFVHRLLAVVLLPLSLVLVVGGFTTQPKRWSQRWIALLALSLVLFLAILGRWTAGSLVPAVTLGNLLGGFLLFALCVRMAVLGRGRADQPPLPSHVRAWVNVAVAIALTQIVLGGLVSSTFAGLSCPSLTDCLSLGSGHWEALNPLQAPRFDAGDLPVNAEGAILHALHRWGAVAAALAIFFAGILLLRNGRRIPALALFGLMGMQLALGVMLVHNGLPLAVAVAHNAIAASLLAVLLSVD